MGKICRLLAQYLVRLTQLAVLALERLYALALLRCCTGPQTLAMLSPPHPVAQCLARAADLLGNRVDRRPLGSVLGLVVQDHPNRASTDLRGIWGNSLRHGSILSRVGASGKPGAVHSVPSWLRAIRLAQRCAPTGYRPRRWLIYGPRR